ncbi:hypothetical protein [Actinoplanes subglobosus]|uniref:Secreted protein n=1 Tax=Actinoplanes subglobosus TaxID=1547892 RepID=A0ABV8J6K3_9ACTN
MSQAIFVIVGALIGVLGALVNEFARSRREYDRARKKDLREVAVSLAGQVSRISILWINLDPGPADDAVLAQMRDAHSEINIAYERLRLIAESRGIQEAARHVSHHAYWLVRAAAVGSLKDAELLHRKMKSCLAELYVEVRREVGMRSPGEVYQDPEDGLPEPSLPVISPGRPEDS